MTLRIVAGQFRGRKLETAAGDAVRPTAERVREAVFNTLSHGLLARGGAPLGDIGALDVCAGSGAMGFEALSRGAREVTFIENDGAVARLIERNAAHLGVAARARVLRRDATSPGPAHGAAELVFVDAPYGAGRTEPALKALVAHGWLADGAVVVVEIGRGEAFEAPDGFDVFDERRYGAARIIYLRKA